MAPVGQQLWQYAGQASSFRLSSAGWSASFSPADGPMAAAACPAPLSTEIANPLLPFAVAQQPQPTLS